MAKKVSTEIEKVKITFKVQLEFELDEQYKEIFMVGNLKELGAWLPAKALDLKKTNQIFSKTKTFNKGEILEFKFLLTQTYDKVELGKNFNEIENRTLICDKNKTVDFVIENFKL